MPDGTAALDPPTCTADERLADWLASAAERFEWFRHVAGSAEVATATKQFVKPSGTGRARGRIALERAFAPVAHLEARGDAGRLPFLIWSIINPRPELGVVSVNLAAAIRFEDGRASILSMCWSAAVAHSALADALRHGEQDLDAVLMELHAALLDAPAGVVDVAAELAVPAGSGWFVGVFCRATAGNEPCVIFQAERWVPGGPPEGAEPIGVAAEGEPSMASGAMDPLRLASAQWPSEPPASG